MPSYEFQLLSGSFRDRDTKKRLKVWFLFCPFISTLVFSLDSYSCIEWSQKMLFWWLVAFFSTSMSSLHCKYRVSWFAWISKIKYCVNVVFHVSFINTYYLMTTNKINVQLQISNHAHWMGLCTFWRSFSCFYKPQKELTPRVRYILW